MRDPDLVVRAQLAAAALESAWHRWRVVHRLAADPMPTVSSYVGYSLEEPWGQPRVVFGLAAEDAEQLAALLERHDCVGPVYAAVATLPGAREMPPRPGSLFGPLPVPRQAAANGAEANADLPSSSLSSPAADKGDMVGYDEPLFRQAAAAMAEAAAVRELADGGGPESSDDWLAGEDRPDIADGDPAPDCAERDGDDPQVLAGEEEYDLTLDITARMGSLAQAASAARADAEARIRAVLVDYADHADAVGEVTQDVVIPQIPATDVLEPLPAPLRPEVASGAYSPSVAEAAAAPADDHEAPIQETQDVPSGGPRRSKATRGYPISRLSRGKRSGGVPDAGQPAT